MSSKKTIIFAIHGMFSNRFMWQKYKKFFKKNGFDFHATTLPQHHSSLSENPPVALGNLSLIDYVEQINKKLSNLRIKKSDIILMGHSMGGLLSQLVANLSQKEEKDQFKALILLNPAAPKGINPLRYSTIKFFWSGITRSNFWKKPHKPTLKEAIYGFFSLFPDEEQARMYGKLVHESGLVCYEIGFSAMDKKKSTRVDAGNIKCPILVIGGKLDKVTPPSVIKQVAKKYPQAKCIIYPNHAHWTLSEPGWKKIAEDILSWLSKI